LGAEKGVSKTAQGVEKRSGRVSSKKKGRGEKGGSLDPNPDVGGGRYATRRPSLGKAVTKKGKRNHFPLNMRKKIKE